MLLYAMACHTLISNEYDCGCAIFFYELARMIDIYKIQISDQTK